MCIESQPEVTCSPIFRSRELPGALSAPTPGVSVCLRIGMSFVRHSRLLACGLTILLATLTCRDANEPAIAHEVALSAVIHPMSVVADTSGWPFAECNIHVQVIARGEDVTLGALTFGFFIGPTRNTPLAGAIVPAADVSS